MTPAFMLCNKYISIRSDHLEELNMIRIDFDDLS